MQAFAFAAQYTTAALGSGSSSLPRFAAARSHLCWSQKCTTRFPKFALGQSLSRRDCGLASVLPQASVSHHAAAVATAAADSDNDLWLLVGLGNPGTRYEGTRHNVGFRCIDWIGKVNGIAVDKKQLNALLGSGRVGNKRVLLAKPQTFMNVSGKSVRRIMDFYKIRQDHLVVVYDDLDTEPGKVRLRPKGGHGGHNGMRSIIATLCNSQDFVRIRVGIGRPAGRISVADWVLQNFGRNDNELVEDAVREAEAMCASILVEGIDRALSGVRV